MFSPSLHLGWNLYTEKYKYDLRFTIIIKNCFLTKGDSDIQLGLLSISLVTLFNNLNYN